MKLLTGRKIADMKRKFLTAITIGAVLVAYSSREAIQEWAAGMVHDKRQVLDRTRESEDNERKGIQTIGR